MKQAPTIDDFSREPLISKLFKAMETMALINSTTDLNHLINLILKATREVMGVEASSLAQIDFSTNRLYYSHAVGGSKKVKNIHLGIGEGIAGHVASTKQPMIVNDVSTSEYHYKDADRETHFITRRIICVPLVVRDMVIGVLQGLNKIGDSPFDDLDLKLFTAFANQVTVALENARLYNLAVYDGLTGIFDRRYFNAWITTEYARVKRYGTQLSFIILDIDHFKQVNDTHGHQAGDYVLKTLSALIKNRIRKSDLFARYGGEELVLVLPETEMKVAIGLAEQHRKLIEKTDFIFNNRKIPVTISLGVSSYQDRPEETVDQFIENADKMLYLAKESGRNQVRPLMPD